MGIGNIGWTEFLVILALALIFFGPRRLPGIAQAMGKALREFQKALNEVKTEIAQAQREGQDTKSYVQTMLPPTPLSSYDSQRQESAPIPEDAEPESTREADAVSGPRGEQLEEKEQDRDKEEEEDRDEDKDEEKERGKERGRGGEGEGDGDDDDDDDDDDVGEQRKDGDVRATGW